MVRACCPYHTLFRESCTCKKVDMMNNENILDIRDLTKKYPGVVALDHVSFSVKKGEIHALCGENGAGKSTLIKILYGAALADEGTVLIDGKQSRITAPSIGLEAGISVVNQELKLAEDLNIAENIYLGHLPKKRRLISLVDWQKVYQDADALFRRMNIDYDVHQIVSDLSVAQKQIVEIAKALSHESRILIMDEPSATLTEKELDTLFDIIRLLKKQGVTIIYISHRLEEIFELADRVTVLRDGKYIGTLEVKDTDKKQLISMMVGRELDVDYPKEVHATQRVVLEVNHLSTTKIHDVSFKVYGGEVFGLAGLVGAGRTEVARAIFGADKRLSGEIKINGTPVEIANVHDAIHHKIALLPEERKTQGCVLGMTLRENTTLANLSNYKTGLLVNRKQETRSVNEHIRRLSIKAPNCEVPTSSLSGGNQQKIVLAKWLDVNGDIIIFDEPTRGIDVGAKREIYQIINEMTANGKTVIMISSDMPELIGMCDRILVMHEGRMKGELQRAEFSQDKILGMALS